jgi:hypothetical protein
MVLFDRPNYLPQRWGEFSLDYKLFFICEISLFAAIIFAQSGIFDPLSDTVYYGAAGGALALLILIAIIHRVAKHWRWGGVSARGVARTLFGGVLMAAFLVVFAHGLLPVRHKTAPMLAFAASIVVFNLLSSLNLVQRTRAEFERFCSHGSAIPEKTTEDTKSEGSTDLPWMRALRGAFTALFILVWIEAMTFFYVHERFVDEGTRQPTATRTQYVNEHGTFVYFTDDQMRIHNMLETSMMVGIPGIIFGGFVLHFVVGVPMFNNLRASRGLFRRSDD